MSNLNTPTRPEHAGSEIDLRQIEEQAPEQVVRALALGIEVLADGAVRAVKGTKDEAAVRAAVGRIIEVTLELHAIGGADE